MIPPPPSSFPDENLYNSIMIDAKSFLLDVFEAVAQSSPPIFIDYTDNLNRDIASLIALLKCKRAEMHRKFPDITDLTLIELEHLLAMHIQSEMHFNSDTEAEDVVVIGIILRRLALVFLPSQIIKFIGKESQAMQKVCLVRNQELKEMEDSIEKTVQLELKQCKGFPDGNLCFNVAVGKPEGKQRFVPFCKECMTERQSIIAKKNVEKKRRRQKFDDYDILGDDEWIGLMGQEKNEDFFGEIFKFP